MTLLRASPGFQLLCRRCSPFHNSSDCLNGEIGVDAKEHEGHLCVGRQGWAFASTGGEVIAVEARIAQTIHVRMIVFWCGESGAIGGWAKDIQACVLACPEDDCNDVGVYHAVCQKDGAIRVDMSHTMNCLDPPNSYSSTVYSSTRQITSRVARVHQDASNLQVCPDSNSETAAGPCVSVSFQISPTVTRDAWLPNLAAATLPQPRLCPPPTFHL